MLRVEFRATRPVGGGRAAWPAYARRWQTAGAAGDAAAARQRGRLDRPADRRAVGRVAAGDASTRACRCTSPGCASSSGDEPAASRARPATRCGSIPSELDLAPLRAARGRGRQARHPATRGGEAAGGARAVARAAARRPRLRAVRAGARSRGSRSCAWPRSSSGSRPTSPLGRHAELVGELEALIASASAARAPARPADARPLPLRPPGGGARRPTARRARRSSTSSASSPAARCASSNEAILAQDPALDARRRSGRATVERRPAARSWAASASSPQLLGGLERCLRRARAAVPARAASRASARAAWPTSWPRTRGRAARGCWSAAAGRPAARPPTGRGCRRCAPTCATATPTALRAPARRRCGRPRPDHPGAARALPGPAAAVPARAGGRALPALRRDRRVPAQRRRRAARSCSCSTTCTRPTSPRCCCCASSRASSASTPAAGARAPTATSTRCRDSRLARDARRGRPRAGDAPRSRWAGSASPRSPSIVELTASELASPRLAAALHDETEGNPLFVGEIVRLLSVEGALATPDASRLAIPQSVRDVIARRLGHLSAGVQPAAGARVGARPRVRARRARAAWAASRTTSCSTRLDEAIAARIVVRRPRHAGSPALRARADPRHALRRAPGRPPREAAPRRGRRRSSSSTPSSPDHTSRSSRATRSPAATPSGGSATPAAPATGRSGCSPTRRPRACSGWRSRRSTAGSREDPRRAQRAAARAAAMRSRGRGASPTRRRRSWRPPTSRGARGCPSCFAHAALGYGGRSRLAAGRRRRPPRAAARGGACRHSASRSTPLRARLLARLAGRAAGPAVARAARVAEPGGGRDRSPARRHGHAGLHARRASSWPRGGPTTEELVAISRRGRPLGRGDRRGRHRRSTPSPCRASSRG